MLKFLNKGSPNVKNIREYYVENGRSHIKRNVMDMNNGMFKKKFRFTISIERDE